MSGPEDLRDQRVGDALGTLAGTDEPPYDRLFERVRQRGRARQAMRWTAICTAVAVFVGGVTWAGLSIAGHRAGTPVASEPPRTGPSAIAPPSSSTTTGNVPEIGLSMTYPADWYTERIRGDCMLDPVGLLVANVPGPYGTTETSDGCRWPQSMGALPSTAVVVEIDRYNGGPHVGPFDPTKPSKPPFPLSLSQISHEVGPLRTAYGRTLTIGGDHRYQVFAWIGNDASPADRDAAAKVVASIESTRCAAPEPGRYDPSLTPATGSAGSPFTVAGEVPVYAEDGSYAGPRGWIGVWWDADPVHWEDLVGDGRLRDVEAGRTPAPGPGDAVFLGSRNVEGSCEYSMALTTPAATPGLHHVVVLEIGSGGAAEIGALEFTVQP